nr:phage BR0599 family protein [Sphingopyxis sp. EG6]
MTQFLEALAESSNVAASARAAGVTSKQLATCRERFANAINFRGEAHLPGNDLLTRYPGG